MRTNSPWGQCCPLGRALGISEGVLMVTVTIEDAAGIEWEGPVIPKVLQTTRESLALQRITPHPA